MDKFVELLEKLLIAENNKTKEEAEKLIKAHPNIVTQGIMSGRLRSTAMALEMAEN